MQTDLSVPGLRVSREDQMEVTHGAEVKKKAVHSRKLQNNDVMTPYEGLREWLGLAEPAQ